MDEKEKEIQFYLGYYTKSYEEMHTDLLGEVHKELSKLISYLKNNTEPDLKIQEIIDKFGSFHSSIMRKGSVKEKDEKKKYDKKKDRKKKDHKKKCDKKKSDGKKSDKLLVDQYLDICSKIASYSGKSKCINARIASFNEFLRKSEHFKWFVSTERKYENEEEREAVGVVVSDYFLSSNQKTKDVAEQIESTEQNIEFLKGEIENTKFCLESVNELSQSMEQSSLSEDNGIVTKDDLDNANAFLEGLLEKGKEADRELRDYCKKENIKMSDIDEIILQSNTPVQKNKTVNNGIKKLESELTQMLSEKVLEMKKELQDKEKLLTKKKVRQSDFEGKYKKLLVEIESINSKEDGL